MKSVGIRQNGAYPLSHRSGQTFEEVYIEDSLRREHFSLYENKLVRGRTCSGGNPSTWAGTIIRTEIILQQLI